MPLVLGPLAGEPLSLLRGTRQVCAQTAAEPVLGQVPAPGPAHKHGETEVHRNGHRKVECWVHIAFLSEVPFDLKRIYVSSAACTNLWVLGVPAAY